MNLSEIGKIAHTEWMKTFEMRPDMNLWMGEYVVMPNHIHAIIGIGENEYNTQRDVVRNVETQCIASLPPPPPRLTIQIYPKPKTNSDHNQKIGHPSFAVLKLG